MSREWYEARVLAIGGAGFVGSNLTKKLLDAGAEEIVIVDNLLSSELENIAFFKDKCKKKAATPPERSAAAFVEPITSV